MIIKGLFPLRLQSWGGRPSCPTKPSSGVSQFVVFRQEKHRLKILEVLHRVCYFVFAINWINMLRIRWTLRQTAFKIGFGVLLLAIVLSVIAFIAPAWQNTGGLWIYRSLESPTPGTSSSSFSQWSYSVIVFRHFYSGFPGLYMRYLFRAAQSFNKLVRKKNNWLCACERKRQEQDLWDNDHNTAVPAARE